MNIVFEAGYYADTKIYSDNLLKTIEEIYPIVNGFYNDYFGVGLDKVVVKTRAFEESPKIHFHSNSNKPYAELKVDVTQLGSAFLPPSERKWENFLFFKNVDVETQNILYLVHKLSIMNIVNSEGSSLGAGSVLNPTEKVKDVFSKSDAWIREYMDFLSVYLPVTTPQSVEISGKNKFFKMETVN